MRTRFAKDLKQRDVPIIQKVCKATAKELDVRHKAIEKEFSMLLYKNLKDKIEFDLTNVPGDNNFIFGRLLKEWGIDPLSYLDVKALKKDITAMIADIRHMADTLIPTQLDKDPNYNLYNSAILSKHGMPKYQIIKHIRDIYEKWQADQNHWDKQKLKVYSVIVKTAPNSCGKEQWFENTKKEYAKLDIANELNKRTFQKFFENYWNVLDKEQKDKLDTLSKEVSARKYSQHRKNAIANGSVVWNKGINGKKKQEWLKKVDAGRKKFYKEKA
jgi:hypothetical protein